MKRMKKVATVLLTICLLCPAISSVVYAASAQLQFSDPSTTVGAEVEVKVRLASTSSVKTLDASLVYDKEMLRFINGGSATGSDGTVTISGTGTGNEIVLMLKFQALKEGTAQITVGSASGTASDGQALEITQGSSKVSIGPGDPSLIQEEQTAASVGAGTKVTVDDVEYTITNEFSDALIPTGFSRSEMTYEGEKCQVILQDSSGETAMYLTPSDGESGEFFLYNGTDGTFTPFEVVDISQDRYILLLRNDGTVKLPENYQETTLTLNGKEFPVWQNSKENDFYVLYALNSDGKKLLYQYDKTDQTYQRYIEEKSDTDDKKTSSKGLLGKVAELVKSHLMLFAIGIGLILLFLFVVLIVVAIKLRYRNLELDDLYDEYGIDDEAEETKKKENYLAYDGKGKLGKEFAPAVRKPTKAQYDNEDDFEEDDFVDDFEDDFETLEEDFIEDDFDNAYYEDDNQLDEISDLDAMLLKNTKKKRGHVEEDDAFKVDFIDLD